MKKKVLLIGGVAIVVVLAGGFALAQMRPHGPGGFAPPFMHGDGPGAFNPGMGPGMMRMGPGMMHGPGAAMPMGPGMMNFGQDTATRTQLGDIHALLADHDKVKRTVTNLPNGIRTATESDDPQIAALIKRHVAEMGGRVKAGDNPHLPIQSPALNAIYDNKDKIQTSYEMTEKGVIVTQTSADTAAVTALQKHAAEVTDLVRGGMAALRTAMMRNHGGMMGAMMHGPMMQRGPNFDAQPNPR